ncbi:IS3 family transposase, partial [Saccharopolyspora shandongensis]|uniref:IS3 family transposase n=1 Tax=Saccharopolyspora shandongensis TaxID=418495 RepID=UPI0033F5F7F4
MKVQAVISLKAEHSLEDLLAAAGLARSTFFYHQARLRRADPQAELKAAITTVFEANQGRYGHRRVHAVLIKKGWRVAKKTVLKLMRQLDLICRIRRRRYNSFKGEAGKTAPNLLARDFTATAPNQKWVTDVTEFAIGDQKVYLSPIMDLFDRQIIAYQVGNSPNLTLTNTALQDALATLKPSGQAPLVHTDQGFQYQHVSWRKLLASAGATQSMSRKGNCLDNAVIESFFGHLKEELFHHTTYLSAAA